MSLTNWVNTFGLAALVGGVSISGCTPEHPSERDHPPFVPGSETAKPAESTHKQVGEASWYGGKFHGRETASGTTFNKDAMTAAHPSLPMGTKAEVTNLENGKSVEVTINDRGPAVRGRAIDLSSGAAKQLNMKKDGTAQVKIVTKSKKKRVRSGHAKPRKDRP